MKNMRVSKKLIVSFLIVIVLAVIIGGVGIIGMMQINDGSTNMYEHQTMPLGDIAEAREMFQRLRVQLRNIALASGDIAELDAIQSDVDDRETRFWVHMQAYRETILAPEVIAMYASMETNFYEFERGMNSLSAQARAGADPADLLAYMRANTVVPSDMVADLLTEMMEHRIGLANDNNATNAAMFSSMLILIIAVLVVAIAVALTLAVYISGLISKPLTVLSSFMKKAGSTGDLTLSPQDVEAIHKFGTAKDEIGQTVNGAASFVTHVTNISKELETIAGGDLTSAVNTLSKDDTMGNSLQNLLSNLNSMFGEIQSSTAQVATGSKQIADGSQSLAQGSTEQAASVQELSSSIAEIAQKTKGNADMAGRASMLAGDIKTSAEKGSRQMGEMMDAVRDINASSQNISKVIKSIDDIAFQTNILGLNAAVEAARAGQHGKGFAVVAEEVRNLAAKSAEAAKDTESLIADSIEKAELGSRIADDTSASLTEIVAGIGESSQLVTEIAKSSEEQSEGIGQINRGIDQVAQVIQQNSATAEQSAAASEEMSGQSMMLEELI